ncbi:hypothetical protein LSAT2_020544 [Lamellibrachia satsuma]|nr:hypothetical protein LSAT2_020544 [Lamellibrachia satsuma]
MKRATAAKPRSPPKKAKYANAYKVTFEADFPWAILCVITLTIFSVLNHVESHGRQAETSLGVDVEKTTGFTERDLS